MPDKWEYPWYASWDLAFHCITLALVDADLAKAQIELLARATYQHPNGQVPAYEWAFGDVNPPVLPYAALRVFQLEEKYHGKGDRAFLERVFHKFLLNFTWWVNRKDSEGNNVFQVASSVWTTSVSLIAALPCLQEASSSRAMARAGWACSALTC